MTTPYKPDLELEKRLFGKLMDVFIRVGLVIGLVVLCYLIFAPFLPLMVWALILAVTLFPTHQWLARALWGRQGLAALVLVLAGIVLIVAPTAMLMNALGDSVHAVVDGVRDQSLQIPAPMASVAEWPIVGKKLYGLWAQAHADLPALAQSLQPKVGDLAKTVLGTVASIGSSVLLFFFSFIIAGVIMAFGRAGAGAAKAIFCRIVGNERGERFARLSTATIRAVALGVLGVALIQSIVIGLIFMLIGIPFAALLAMVVLVLAIAQLPALLVTLPVIGYMWTNDSYGVTQAIAYSVLLALGGMLDNVLKPLMLGRGVDAPMPVILMGALGGMAGSGIMGMFVGAALLTLGYQIFMGWVASNPDNAARPQEPPAQT